MVNEHINPKILKTKWQHKLLHTSCLNLTATGGGLMPAFSYLWEIKHEMGKSAQHRLKKQKKTISIAWKCQWEQPRSFWGEVYPLFQAHSNHTHNRTPASPQTVPNPNELQHPKCNHYSPQEYFLPEQVHFLTIICSSKRCSLSKSSCLYHQMQKTLGGKNLPWNWAIYDSNYVEWHDKQYF